MDSEALGAAIEIAFIVGGLAILAWGWIQRPPAAEESGVPPRATLAEFGLTAVALAGAAVPSNILVLALTPGMPTMPF